MLVDLQKLEQELNLTIINVEEKAQQDCKIPDAFKQIIRKFNEASIQYYEYSFCVTSSDKLKIYFPNQLWYYAATCSKLYIELIKYWNIVKTRLNLDDETIKRCKGDESFAKSIVDASSLDETDKQLLCKFLFDYSWWKGGKGVERQDFYYSPIISICKLVNASQSFVADMSKMLAGYPTAADMLTQNIDLLDTPKKSKIEIVSQSGIAEFMGACVREFLLFDSNLTQALKYIKYNQVTAGFQGCQFAKTKSSQLAVVDPRRKDDCDQSIVWNMRNEDYFFCKEQTGWALNVFAEKFNKIYENIYEIDIAQRPYKLYKITVGSKNAASSNKLQLIYYGAPGTGKSKTIKREVEDKGMIHFRTTFHPDSDYSTFVGCYKPTMVEAPVRDGSGHEVNSATENEKKRISYSFIPQAFTKAYCEAWNNFADEDKEPVFLIIEEINRGNCAQIFGDIFQLLDRKDDGYSDYPIDADEDLKKFMLTGTKEDGSQWLVNKDGIKDGKLCLPPNLHIWATMNTSDQSLFPIDSAFKRRWEWKYMPISDAKKSWKISVNGNEYDWWSFLEKINGKIWDATHSEDKKLGYFFCKADGNNVISAEKFVGKVLFYIYNDVFKDYGFDDAIFKDTSDVTQLLFQSYFQSDGMPNENKIEILLKNLEVIRIGDSATAPANVSSEEASEVE